MMTMIAQTMYASVLLLLLLVAVGSIAAAAAAPPLGVWPMPKQVSSGIDSISLDAKNFQFTSSCPNNGVLNRAFQRYAALIFPSKLQQRSASAGVILQELRVNVADDTAKLELGSDESYSLTVSKDQKYAQLNSKTVWGALRGLETFSQLVSFDDSSNSFIINRVPISINDNPRFTWRGLLVDSARHYLSVGKMLSILDAMSYSKFNVLHWHIVDAQSFPLEISTFPMLSKAGAYSPKATYSHDDINKIVQYALDRGIRVVPEFDNPGHSASWGKYYKVTTNCPNYSHNVNNIPINPAFDLTWDVISGVVAESTTLFPDSFIHSGGDEVVQGCWKEDSTVTNFMNKMGFGSDYNKLSAYCEDKISKIYDQNNRTMVVWEEVGLDNPYIKVPATTIMEAWKNVVALRQLVQKGFRSILAAGWYLDQQVPPGGVHYEWLDTWQNFYLNEPFDKTWTNAERKLVLGGEGCMWGEQVDDTNFDSRVWPRACAIAERLWSDESINSVTDALPRLISHRCRLVQRGVRADPLFPDYCPAVYDA